MNETNNVLVTGITGQDGSWMAEYLLDKGYNVYGGVRRTSQRNLDNVAHIVDPRFHIVDLDIADPISVSGVIEDVQPNYLVNFAANSFVGSSWDMPVNCFQTNTMSVLYMLDAIRRIKPRCRFYNAGSSEEWGNVDFTPQDETHPLKPRSPYGASKASARHIVKVYRESYGLYAVQGWLFNHEGTRRGIEFVTRKISRKVAEINHALKTGAHFEPLELGNLDSRRDWGDAEDYVDAVWRMLNQGIPELSVPLNDAEWNDLINNHIKDYVVSTDECHTIREFVELAFKWAGVLGDWSYSVKGVCADSLNPTDEVFIEKGTNRVLMRINPKFYRPAEIDILKGDSTAIRRDLGWSPKTDFPHLVKKMVKHDLLMLKKLV